MTASPLLQIRQHDVHVVRGHAARGEQRVLGPWLPRYRGIAHIRCEFPRALTDEGLRISMGVHPGIGQQESLWKKYQCIYVHLSSGLPAPRSDRQSVLLRRPAAARGLSVMKRPSSTMGSSLQNVHHCSCCGATDHNLKTCPAPGAELVRQAQKAKHGTRKSPRNFKKVKSGVVKTGKHKAKATKRYRTTGGLATTKQLRRKIPHGGPLGQREAVCKTQSEQDYKALLVRGSLARSTLVLVAPKTTA